MAGQISTDFNYPLPSQRTPCDPCTASNDSSNQRG